MHSENSAKIDYLVQFRVMPFFLWIIQNRVPGQPILFKT
jgi:hypothetical protein